MRFVYRTIPNQISYRKCASGRGRPSVPGEVAASVMVLQALGGLSDRQACMRLQTDTASKADEAFHPTVLTLWRSRLRASVDPDRVFGVVSELIAECGAVAKSHRRVLDSTVLDDAVARQDTVTMLVNQIRRVRRLHEGLAEVWVRERNLGTGGAVVDWGDPADVERLVSELVDDALELIGTAEDLELDDAQGDAVALLALVAGQDVEPGDGPGRWRIARRTAPGRIVSTVDPESRHVHKSRSVYRDGYKAHIAAEPDTGLITAVDLTAGDVGDAQAAPGLIADEAAGTEVYGDSAYGTGDLRSHLADRDMTAVIKPPPIQTAVPGGYSIDDFDIDTDAGTVTCPEGITVTISPKATARCARSGETAAHARCEDAAPPPKTGAPSKSTPTTSSSTQPANWPAPTASTTTTADGGPWPNAPSRGSCATTEDAPTEASTKTGNGSPPAPQQSTSNDSPTSESHTTAATGPSTDPHHHKTPPTTHRDTQTQPEPHTHSPQQPPPHPQPPRTAHNRPPDRQITPDTNTL